MQVDGPLKYRPKKTWMEVAHIDLKMCNPSEHLGQDKLEWRNRILVANLSIVGRRL